MSVCVLGAGALRSLGLELRGIHELSTVGDRS